MRYEGSRRQVLAVLSDGSPKSCRQISKASGLSVKKVENSVYLCWLRGLVLRTASPVYEHERVNLGRRGRTVHTRPYHLYLFSEKDMESSNVDGRSFVSYSEEHLDPRGGHVSSKSSRVLDFLRSNPGETFYSTVIVKRLSEFGV